GPAAGDAAVSAAEILESLVATARGVVIAIVPLVFLFIVFQLSFLRLPRREVYRVLTGTLLAAAGLFMFLAGVHIGYLPFGTAIGEAVGNLRHAWLVAAIGGLLGFVTAWGEPAVRILAQQVETASTGSIRKSTVLWAVCIGVASAVAVGMLRIA